MNELISAISIDEIYGDNGMTDEEFYSRLDRSLNPRGSSILYDKVAALGLSQAHHLLDVGCRDGRHSLELASRFGCEVTAIDPVVYNIAKARKLVADRGFVSLVHVAEGRMEEIPCLDGSVDFIWCRDVTSHVPGLHDGIMECARVLRPGGAMLLYQTFATELLEPREAEHLYSWTAAVPENMSGEYFEASVEGTGLHIAERDLIGSEWREHEEENGRPHTSKQLLYIARMRRGRDHLIGEVGRLALDAEMGNSLWGVYQMLGKLCPTVYVLMRD